MSSSAEEQSNNMRILAIINLKSGQGDAGVYDYLRKLGSHEAEVVIRFLGSKRTIASMVEDAREFDRVVAVGGDGTVSGVCYALRNTGVPIVVYPAGTANLVALNIGVPTEPTALAEMTLHGAIRAFDMGEICTPDSESGDESTDTCPLGTARGFVVGAGAGFDAKIMEGADRLKHTIGFGGYIVAVFQNLAPTVSKFHLTLDGEEHETEGIAVLVVNFAKLQWDLSITHKSDPSDGVFEVVVARTRNAVELLPAVWSAILDRTSKGAYPNRSAGLEIHEAKEIIIRAKPPLSLQYDGEVLNNTTPVQMTMLPGAVTFVTPE